MEINQAAISGVVIEVESQRTSPGGIAHQRFMLQHRSRQEQVGQPREVFCRILVEMRGDLVAQAQPIAVNDRLKVEGFWDRASYKDDMASKLILHAQKVQKLS